MKAPKDSLLLIDGHALLYRAFHALPPLKNKAGIPTNAVYGFITTLIKAFEDIHPKYCAVAFDVAGPTFRHKSFAGYKASRPDTPTDLLQQVPYTYEVIEAMNIPIFTKEGFEADDIIGTLAKQAKSQNIPVVIVTGDKDSFQLVDDSTFVYIPKRTLIDTQLYDPAGVVERMGVTPAQIPDFKALSGDASDEIPGIAGIGEKTAVTILKQSPSIEALYAAVDKGNSFEGLSERIIQKIKDGEAIARQSRELATIDRSVPIQLEIDACVIHEYDATKVAEVFQKLEFYSLLKRLPLSTIQGDIKSAPIKRDWSFTTITNEEELRKMVQDFMNAETISLDTETNGLRGKIIGIALAANGFEGFYIPLIPEHDASLDHKIVTEILQPLFNSPDVGKVGHNIKCDLESLDQLGLEVLPISFDTMIAAYILHAHLRSFDLDTASQRELGYTMISYADVAGSTKKQASLVTAPIGQAAEYAAEEAIITYRLYEAYKKQLDAESNLKIVAETIDFPLVQVLKRMEARGVCLDVKKLEALEKEIEQETGTIKAKIELYATGPININSPVQLQKLLFEDLKLERQGIKSNQKGLSTAAQELEKLQGLHPVIEDILRYRELTKLQNTYVQILPKLADKTGRVHTQFSQTTAATGRLASSDPNLQNIPIRSELGNKIRATFVAPKGYDLLSLDYSQIELRIIAHLSQDKNLKQVFIDGRDIHDEVAKRLEIDRRAAKAINFGIFYGLSAFGLSQSLKIEQKVAKQYIDAYFETYSEVAKYLQDTKQSLRETGYVETLFGRRREIPEIHASNSIVRAQAERIAINAPAQGTAADLMKLAMIEVDDWLEQEYGGQTERPHLLLQVHDELLLESPHALTKEVGHKVKTIMQNITKLSVPLDTDCAVGANWGELEEIKLD